MAPTQKNEGYIEGQLLIATPSLSGSVFEKAVIYICAHTPDGAMGLIINQLIEAIDMKEIFKQLNIELPHHEVGMPVHFGGPVDSARGFVLHSKDYAHKETVVMGPDISLTSNIEVLKDIAAGNGPKHSLLALGYAGWAPGQLESELETNSWITAPATLKLVFNTKNKDKWEQAAASEGIDLTKLSGDIGHA